MLCFPESPILFDYSQLLWLQALQNGDNHFLLLLKCTVRAHKERLNHAQGKTCALSAYSWTAMFAHSRYIMQQFLWLRSRWRHSLNYHSPHNLLWHQWENSFVLSGTKKMSEMQILQQYFCEYLKLHKYLWLNLWFRGSGFAFLHRAFSFKPSRELDTPSVVSLQQGAI